MTVAVIVVSAALGVMLVVLVAKRARTRSNRRFEALLREVDDSLAAIAQTFQDAADRSGSRGATDREPIPQVGDLLERIAADGAAVRAFKEIARHVVPLDEAGELASFQHYGYEAELERTISNAGRTGRPLALVLLDLGYSSAGDDRIPAELAALLARVSRATDTVCRRRFGELGVLLPETTADGARRFHRRVREEMARTGLGQIAQATFAAGIVEWGPDETSDSFDARARAATDRTVLGLLEPAEEDAQAPYGQRPVL